MRPLARKLMFLVLFAAAGAIPSYAEDEDVSDEEDVVTLSNGSRLSGEIVELSRARLSFDLGGAGPVEIRWDNVETLRSPRRLDVETASGRRFLGTVTSPSAGKLRVTTPTGPQVFDMEDVVRITPIEASFRDRTSGALDLGFDFLSANDEIDWTLNAEAENRTRNYLTEVSISSLLRRRDSDTDQRRNHFELGVRRFLYQRWFVLGLFEAEEDRELDLDLRTVLGGAVGRTLLQSNRTVFALYGGLDYDLEEYRDIPGTDHSAEVLAGLEWDWFELGGNTELSTLARTYFSLDRSRVRLTLDSSLRRDIVRSFYWSLNLYESYDSDPPADLEKSDFGLTVTIGSTF